MVENLSYFDNDMFKAIDRFMKTIDQILPSKNGIQIL
jgi:hypothetical protein